MCYHHVLSPCAITMCYLDRNRGRGVLVVVAIVVVLWVLAILASDTNISQRWIDNLSDGLPIVCLWLYRCTWVLVYLCTRVPVYRCAAWPVYQCIGIPANLRTSWSTLECKYQFEYLDLRWNACRCCSCYACDDFYMTTRKCHDLRCKRMCYHHVLSPCAITMCYHHVLSPCAITMCYHHVLSPCAITMCYLDRYGHVKLSGSPSWGYLQPA